MANPLIELLSAGAKVAFPMLSSLAETELSVSAILQRVRDAGYALRTQTAYDVIGALRDNVNAARQFRLISETTIPDPSRFGTSLTKILTNYSYKVKINGGPESFPSHVQVVSNEVLTKSQIKATAESYLSNSERYSTPDEGEEYSLEVVDAIKSPALGE